MKKLLGLVLGLMVSISSAMAGTCNLLDTPAIYTNATWDAQTGTVTNTKTDTRFPLSYTIQLVSSGAGGTGPAANGTATSFSGPITYTKTFTTSSDTHWLRFYTSGQDTNIATLAFPCEPNTTYTFSMDVVSVDPTTVGGVVYTHMQLEKGTTATAYVPYDPNCNPCPSGQVLRTYTSATGTVTQNGTPTPENPVYPTFYTQGDMVLRKLNNTYYDSYDATTGKITRRIRKLVLTGQESWVYYDDYYCFALSFPSNVAMANRPSHMYSTHFPFKAYSGNNYPKFGFIYSTQLFINNGTSDIPAFKAWLAEQYANGTPVTVYYPLATPVEEDWPSSYCASPIKIATTKYNAARFDPLVTALNTAIGKIKDVVATTIAQTSAVADLHSGKQTKPSDTACPDYKQCLLVEDSNGTPHWYEISDPFRDFVTPIIATSTAANSITNNAGYTQLEYIESTGTQYIDTGISGPATWEFTAQSEPVASNGGNKVLVGRYNQYATWFAATSIGYWGAGSVEGYYTDIPNTTKATVSATFTATQVSGTVNGSSFLRTATAFDEWNNYTLLGYNDNYLFTGKLYSAKCTQNNTLVRDFVPVRRNSDGKYGMYNLAATGNQQVFYPNSASSGDDFIPGPEVINQDPAIPGMTWTATWTGGNGVTAGTVSGVARCAPVAGTNVATTANPTKYSQLSSANQTAWNVAFNSTTLSNYKYCWCKITGISSSGENIYPMGVTEWVYDTNAAASVCATQCSRYCAYYVNQGSEGIGFRKALFGQ